MKAICFILLVITIELGCAKFHSVHFINDQSAMLYLRDSEILHGDYWDPEPPSHLIGRLDGQTGFSGKVAKLRYGYSNYYIQVKFGEKWDGTPFCDTARYILSVSCKYEETEDEVFFTVKIT
ncbi:hypothetical protein GEMRC1_000736 [Eukaryota sp. GEM-RC1]